MASSKDVIKSFTIKVNTKNGKVQVDGITRKFEESEKAFKKLTNTVVEGANTQKAAMSGVSKASGGATATVLEAGRTISDMNYGIRGVANNLSQLASNFLFTTRSAGGFGGAMKAIGGAMMGPLGILIAIQTGIALLEAWSMRQKEASFSMTGVFGKSITETTAKLQILKNAINDSNLTFKEKKHIVGTAKDELEDLGITVNQGVDNFDALNKALEENIKMLTKRAIAQGFMQMIQEEGNKIAALQVESFENQLGWWDKIRMSIAMTSKQYSIYGTVLTDVTERQENDVKKSNDVIARAYDELTKKLKDGDMYINHLFGDDKDGSGSRKRALKIFKQQLLDLDKLILNHNKQKAMDIEKYEIDKLNMQGSYAQSAVDLQEETFKKKQKQRLDDYLRSIKGHHKEAELRTEAQAKYVESIRLSEIEAGEAKLAIRANYAQKLALMQQEIDERQRTRTADNAIQAINQSEEGADPFAQDANDELREARRAASLRDIDDRLKNERVGTDAYFAILEERLAFTKTIHDEEVASEKAKIDRIKAVQMEYVGFMQQTGSLLTKLAGDNKAMAKIALAVEKGAAIAKVVVEAQQSIASRTAANSALPSFINVPSPTGIISVPNPAKIADKALMVKDNLRTKVGAGLSIANILAQSLSSKGGVKDVGKGSDAKGREFDFNLVGSTGQNQLAQTTAGQLGQPVQAYVVSSEITSQQQMDNTIQSNATFGED